MAFDREEVKGWLEEARRHGATHMLVVCDTYDAEFSLDPAEAHYPVFVHPGEDPRDVGVEYSRDMQVVKEVYAMHLDLEMQLNEMRALHYESP